MIETSTSSTSCSPANKRMDPTTITNQVKLSPMGRTPHPSAPSQLLAQAIDLDTVFRQAKAGGKRRRTILYYVIKWLTSDFAPEYDMFTTITLQVVVTLAGITPSPKTSSGSFQKSTHKNICDSFLLPYPNYFLTRIKIVMFILYLVVWQHRHSPFTQFLGLKVPPSKRSLLTAVSNMKLTNNSWECHSTCWAYWNIESMSRIRIINTYRIKHDWLVNTPNVNPSKNII